MANKNLNYQEKCFKWRQKTNDTLENNVLIKFLMKDQYTKCIKIIQRLRKIALISNYVTSYSNQNTIVLT